MAGAINKAWHADNPMPKNPAREQRIDWHLRHSQACSCREVPESLREEVERRRSTSTGAL
jgi:hypothetical protein